MAEELASNRRWLNPVKSTVPGIVSGGDDDLHVALVRWCEVEGRDQRAVPLPSPGPTSCSARATPRRRWGLSGVAATASICPGLHLSCLSWMAKAPQVQGPNALQVGCQPRVFLEVVDHAGAGVDLRKAEAGRYEQHRQRARQPDERETLRGA